MKFRIVFVTANFCGNSTKILDYLAKKSDVFEIAAVIYDRGSKTDVHRRLKRIRNWYKSGGIPYILWRIYLQLRNKKANRMPKFRYTLREITEKYKLKLYVVGSINSEEAHMAIKEINADLGISAGNRIISKRIYSVPKYGMINLHHGKIPGYRGGPPYFWELFNNEKNIGISVHQIDDKLDHGALYGLLEIPVETNDDTTLLYAKAIQKDFLLVERVIRDIVSGQPEIIEINFTNSKVNTLPRYSEVRDLKKRLGYFVDPIGYRFTKVPYIGD